MERYYLLLSQCVGDCGTAEALHVLGKVCGFRVEVAGQGVISIVSKNSENIVRCSSKLVCARCIVKEVYRASLSEGWDIALGAAAEVLSRELAMRASKERVGVDVEVSDVALRLSAAERALVAEKLISMLRARDNRLVTLRSTPDFHIWVGILSDYLSFGVILQKFRGDRYRSREPHRRVYRRPFALVPQVARLILNLSLNPLHGPFLDAFCGTGATLIEAALEGFYGVGVDLDYENIRGARRNSLQHGVYHLIDLIISDAAHLPFRRDVFALAAFDPPYGRAASCKGRQPHLLLTEALERVLASLKPGARAAFLSPGSEEYSAVAESAERVCSIYVHSSLVRVLWVIEKSFAKNQQAELL